MDKKFFLSVLNKEVVVDFNLKGKGSFTQGKVTDVEDEFVTITNDDCVVCVKYPSITSVRTITAREIKKQADNNRQQQEQQQERQAGGKR